MNQLIGINFRFPLIFTSSISNALNYIKRRNLTETVPELSDNLNVEVKKISDTLKCVRDHDGYVNIRALATLCIHKAVSELKQHKAVDENKKNEMLLLYETFKETYPRTDARE